MIKGRSGTHQFFAMEEENAVSSEKEADSSAEPAFKCKLVPRSAPNRQKLDKEIGEIKSQIEAIENQLQKINGSGQNTPQARLQQIKERRDVSIKRRKDIITQLEELKKQIDTKRDAASQMRSKLQYQSEEQVEVLAKKLEQQLQQHSFRLSEERRLVAEIDKLRRVKKAVRQYNEAKEELNKLRESQQTLRVERDSISSEFGNLRTQDDEIHSVLRKNKEVTDKMKKELDALHERKRKLWSDFKEEQALYNEYKEQKRSETNKLRQQEKQAIAQAKAEKKRELQNSIEPYEVERQYCATLLSFLGKMELQTPSTPASCYSSFANTPMSPEEPKSPLPTVEDEVEERLMQGMEALFCGIPKKQSRKVKRSTSKASQLKKRPVTLTPDLLVQFDKIGVNPPVISLEIPSAIEAIKAQQKLYNRMAAVEMAERAAKNKPPQEKSEDLPVDGASPPSRALTLTLNNCVPSCSSVHTNGNNATDLVNCVVTFEQDST
ncbi:golgin subfamily A member 6-like protein 2 isoform X1 [Neocloeon triangulifer]|uniref:golgin subfamily A member 6-like protein 2 isoform X1 n=1 Tax=Neocloeon triangulifer TaxID=2078957 RepID=UPI00286EFA82|nr:golgin subfamily A member 6-like protein 2 isoform X1 [Neocloeon triangulifer]XP_059482608.1 golgin subfamily A member 6-like protein 2 isoform X1 [Neocloeon triangulifer]XP_059482609.1 golgin subfamily A member 6-like protein 2 isoform X1 [Neocloeon triangulifer]